MSIPEGVDMVVRRRTPNCAIRSRVSAVFGPILSGKRYLIHNHNITTVSRGLLERVFRVRDKTTGQLVAPPKPKHDKIFLERMSQELKRISIPGLFPVSRTDILGYWTGSKRKVYERAYESLLSCGLQRSDAFLKTFVKCEKIDASKGDPAPRVIQPRNPRYNLELARYLKPYEHQFYSSVDAMFDKDGLGDKTIFKGLNATQAAHHLKIKSERYLHPVFVGLDASRFDQHVSVEALQWEHQIYLNSFVYNNELRQLLDWQVHNVGTTYCADGKVKYNIDGCRMSGDVNTSLGNCLLMSSMVHAYCKTRLPKFSLANNGDDCVLIFERKHLANIGDLNSWFHDMGFNIVQEEPVYELESVPFCQMSYITDGINSMVCRDPTVVVSKDLHSTHHFQHEYEYDMYLSEVGEAGRNSHQNVPVLSDFYSSFPKCKVAEYMQQDRTYKMINKSGVLENTPEVRHSFWKAFNILPDHQLALEEIYRDIRFGSQVGSISDLPMVSLYSSRGL